MAERILEASGISVAFGGLQALSDVAFDVEAGEILGIIGPNGAGKTTLLNVLSRFTRPARGARIRLGATELLSTSADRLVDAGLGRTFQSIELSEVDTVLDNVLTGAIRTAARRRAAPATHADAGRRARRDALRERAGATLDAFGIAAFASRRAGDVPYAVQKRAQVCRALMAEPKLLLLDEPASGMEHGEKHELRDALMRLHATSGMSMIVIEHDVGFLTRMCRRMLALDFGKVIAFGPTADVVSAPAVVSAYLGTQD
jgi:branched-chain amino acid transport system ATP-binding protein